jgi:NitT/TauT family transport system substrate-binding protein
MQTRVRVAATGAGVAYYPAFVAQELGYFQEEHLEVETTVPGLGPWVARALASGEVDVALGGIWRPLMYRGRLTTLYAFAQLCDRCPFVLLSRRPVERFEWKQLGGCTVMVPDGAPSPWIMLQGILRLVGVETVGTRFIQQLPGEEIIELFRAGLGDYLITAPPTSELLVEDGVARGAVSLAEAGGLIPWSVYYAAPAFLGRNDNVAGRFARAIQKGLMWTLTHDLGEAGHVLERHFPSISVDVVAKAVRSARQMGVWTNTARVSPDGLSRWQAMLVQAGLIDAPVPYDEIVDSRAADWAGKSPPSGR